MDSQGNSHQRPPICSSPHLLVKPASDVHGQVGVPSERIVPLPKGMDLVYRPRGRLLRGRTEAMGGHSEMHLLEVPVRVGEGGHCRPQALQKRAQ